MTGDSITHLGNSSTRYRYDGPDKGLLEAFASPRPQARFVVGLECLEFTSLCPITSQPDYGKISIAYVPGALCVESKSLKLYLVSYRNHGAFHEDCVNSIMDDLVDLMDPLFIRVYGDFNSRGGIAIKPLALKVNPELDQEGIDEVDKLLQHYDRYR